MQSPMKFHHVFEQLGYSSCMLFHNHLPDAAIHVVARMLLFLS